MAIDAYLADTPAGRLRGKSLPGGGALFAGIPFAAPPTGSLRLRPPRPPQPWRGVRDATWFRPAPPQTVPALMSGPRATPAVSTPTPVMGQGFGLGFAVRIAEGRNPMLGSVGEFYWAGAYGTNFVVDPKEKLVVVLMMQAPTQGANYRILMRQFAHEAITN